MILLRNDITIGKAGTTETTHIKSKTHPSLVESHEYSLIFSPLFFFLKKISYGHQTTRPNAAIRVHEKRTKENFRIVSFNV